MIVPRPVCHSKDGRRSTWTGSSIYRGINTSILNKYNGAPSYVIDAKMPMQRSSFVSEASQLLSRRA